MKEFKYKFILFAFLIAIILLPSKTYALDIVNDQYRFGFSAYECGGADADSFAACKNQYYNNQLTKLSTTTGLSAGTKIMLVLEYTHGFEDNFEDGTTSFNTNIVYDPDFVKVVTYKVGRVTYPAAYAAADTENPIFHYGDPDLYGYGGSIVPSTNWSTNVTNATEYSQVIVNYSSLADGETFTYDNGAIGFVFFEVLSTAAEGQTFTFDLDTTDASASWLSNADGGAVAFASVPITLKMAGEETSDDGTVGSITVTGSNSHAYPIYSDNAYSTEITTPISAGDYYVVVPNSVTSITLNAATNDTNAQFVTTGNPNTYSTTLNLNVGNNSTQFIVSAQNLVQSTYRVYVYRLSADATLQSLQLKNSNINFTFSSNTFTYSSNVLFAVKNTNVNATTSHANATITAGTGAWALNNYNPTPNVKTVSVNAEDCLTKYSGVYGNTCHSQDYTITVNRGAPSTNVGLQDLRVSSRILNKTTIAAGTVDGFTAGTSTREFDLGIVDYETSQLTFTATPKPDSNNVSPTIVSGTGTKNLSVGANTFYITVKAEDDHTENYAIKVYRKSNDNTLGTLTVTSNPSGYLDPAFTDITYGGPYTYHYPSDVTSVEIGATVHDTDKATLAGNTGTYSTLDRNAIITVTSENGDVKTYTIQFEKILSTDNLLSDLTATNANLSPTLFDPATNTYTATVDGTIDSTTIDATLHDNKAIFVEGYGPRTVSLNYGENTIYVRVQSEYGQVNGGGINSYNIVITRSKKSIKTLSSVTITAIIDGVSTDFVATYNSATQTYSIPALPYDTTEATITAVVPTDSLATYTVFNQEGGATVDGVIDLATGSNNATIRVKAHDDSTADYTVSIPRTKNNVHTIEGVTVFGQAATCEGTSCTITVANEHSTLAPSDVVVTLTDEAASVTKPTNTMQLYTSSPATYRFTVTAENGVDSTEYEITITRRKSTDNSLALVEVTTNEGKKYSCSTFVDYACTIAVPSTTTSYTLEATASDTASDVAGTGTFEMGGAAGSLQTKTITVTSEDNIEQTYQITIERSKSTNANLASITIDGNAIEGFDGVNKQVYTVTVPGSTSTINLNATVADTGKAIIENASTTLGRKDLAYGNSNVYTIKVIAEAAGDHVKTYTLTVIRENNIDSSLSMIRVGGVNLPNFASDDTSYSYLDDELQALGESNILVVPYNQTAITVLGIPNDTTYGTVTYNGDTETTIPLHTGANTITITGIAHNTSITTDYTVVVYRELNTSNSVSKIEVAGIEATLNEDTGRYSVTVPNNVTTASSSNVDVTLPAKALTTDPDATVVISSINLQTKVNNQLQIVVTSESGVARTYNVDITRESSDVNTLNSLTVTNGSFSPSFTPNVNEYTVTLPSNATEFTVNYTRAVDTETVENAGRYTLSSSTMDVTVNVIAENGDENPYVLHIVRSASAVSTLSNITVNSGDEFFDLDKEFSPDIYNYVVEVPGTVSSVNLDATKTDERASIREGDLGVKNVSLGDNVFTILVTGETGSGNSTPYTVTIRVLPKDINTLDTLTVRLANGTTLELSPSFTPERESYTIADQPYSVTTVTISATKTDSDSTIVSGTGERSLSTGANTLEVVVKAQNNEEKTYSIRVDRAKNNDATLSTLNVNGTALSPSFDPAVFVYHVVMESDVEVFTPSLVTARANDINGANVALGAAVDINENTETRYDIIVTAENGHQETYTIYAKRKKSSDNKLKRVDLENATLSPSFSSNNDQYTLTIPSNATEFTITGIANDTRARVEGNNTYPKTTETVTLTVIAEDGTEKPYTFNVITADALDNTLTLLEVEGYTLSPDFSKTTVVYDIGEIPFGTTNLSVLATPTNIRSTINYYVDGVSQSSHIVTLPQTLGTKSITVEVIPATNVASQARSYSISYTMVTSTNNYLLSMIPSTGTLSPTFQKGITSYTMTVPYDTDSISFQLVTEDTSASVKSNLTGSNFVFTNIEPVTYTYPLRVGSNTATFTVKAPNGGLKEYQVAITRTNRVASNDTFLSSLSVDNYELSPIFDKDTESYSIGAIPYSLDKLTVRAVGNYAGQTITYSLNGVDVLVTDPANAEINVAGTSGSNLINVHVVAENGVDAKNYQISYTKTASDNSYLASMVDSTRKISFNKTKQDYTIDVDATVNSLTLTLTTEEEHATIGISSAVRTHQWAYEVTGIKGGTNRVVIIITAENGDTRTYTLTINKEGSSELITSVVFGHTIENGMIKTARLDETLLDLKNELDNENSKLQIWNATETVEITDLSTPVATGMIVKLIDLTTGRELDRDIVVVVGDTSGDGEIDLFDAVKILNHYLEKELLTGPYLAAADTSKDNEVDLFDAVKILNHYLEKDLLY